jgi:hypothetical protein
VVVHVHNEMTLRLRSCKLIRARLQWFGNPHQNSLLSTPEIASLLRAQFMVRNTLEF